MKRTLHVLVPRIIDEHNLNAQNQNAKELLSRFVSPCVIWHTFNYDVKLRIIHIVFTTSHVNSNPNRIIHIFSLNLEL